MEPDDHPRAIGHFDLSLSGAIVALIMFVIAGSMLFVVFRNTELASWCSCGMWH